MTGTKRIEYIDIARALAIFLVVAGHWLSGEANPLRQAIYSFHMPLFFIISGLVLKKKEADDTAARLGKLIVKRIRSYFLPYMIWALFYTKLSLKSFLCVLYGSRETLAHVRSVTSLWFLPALMLADILAEVLLFVIRKRKMQELYLACLMVVLSLLGFSLPHPEPWGYPCGLDAALMGCAFMLLGFLLKSLLSWCSKSLFFSLAFSLLSIAGFFAAYHFYPPTVATVNMYKADYGKALPFLLAAILGSLAVLMLSCFLDRLLPWKKLLTLIGSSTLGILVLHKPMVIFVRNSLKEAGYAVNKMGIFFLAGSLSILLLCTLFTWLIIKIAPALLGKEKKA